MPPVVLVLFAVFQGGRLELLDVIFRGSNGLETPEDHVHRIGIARHFLFITAGE